MIGIQTENVIRYECYGGYDGGHNHMVIISLDLKLDKHKSD